MKFEVFHKMSEYGGVLYSEIRCPYCKKKFSNLFLHFVRSNCGCNIVDDILKSKGKELSGRKKAILNGWSKK